MPNIDVTTSHLLSNISLVTDGTALLQNIDTAPVHMFLPKNGATPSAVNGTTQWIIQANTLRDHHLCQLLNICRTTTFMQQVTALQCTSQTAS